ncbi:DUF3576 domain-containing protein [Teichococcus oryzae]|jgi:hypothetical protein|uniref:DUF3576 domain-containing protein n=1 Tax=Teichococcus oryzae TaxID=1608942 RepID=A0A5B2THA4_9PROT|nr:DUF3576 domain-containing protein [Pseudoroseomonas oryzae]KAA2213876.1 DUF3576 domain-containing protein [Pseudoroseomonas oryzae]
MRKLLALGLIIPLAACGYGRQVQNDEYYDDSRRARVQGRLTGSDGILLLGTDRSSPQAAQDGGALGVNAYLWRATLDTLSFLPLTSADPFGGVIITDWYSPPSTPGERFRATAYILGRQLRSDGVRVTVFRQEQRGGNWVDAPVAQSTNTDLENQVLARARELRSQTASR